MAERQVAVWQPAKVGLQGSPAVGTIDWRSVGLTFSIAAVACCGLFALFFGPTASSTAAGLGLAVLMAVRAHLISGGSEWFARRKKGSQAAYALYSRIDNKGAYPVRVILTDEGYRIGLDEGVMEFKDGWLHFNGLRTDFEFKRSSVTNPEQTIQGPWGMPLALPNGQILHIQPYERIDPMQDRVFVHLFNKRFGSWWNHTTIETKGVEVMPPDRPNSSNDVRYVDARPGYLEPFYAFIILGRFLFEGTYAGFLVVALYAAMIAVFWKFGDRKRKKFLAKFRNGGTL